MENISEIFLAALKSLVDDNVRGQKADIARRAGVSPSFFNDILASRKYGSEETRRAIASALGYPGRAYEDFLDIGRKALGHHLTETITVDSPHIQRIVTALNTLDVFETSIIENILTVFSKNPPKKKMDTE